VKKERCSVVPRGPAVPEEENYRVVRRLMQDGRARVAAAGPRASDDARPMRAPPTRHPSRRNRRRAIAWPTHTDRLRPAPIRGLRCTWRLNGSCDWTELCRLRWV